MSDIFSFTVLADTHYYSPSLGTSGRAYELRSGSDQKLLGDSGAVIDASFRRIAASDTRAVLIAGDLTNNGEVASHREFREKLRILAQSKPIFVTTATHDWCSNDKNNRYSGNRVISDVPCLKPGELADYYGEFGIEAADSTFVTEIGCVSYSAHLGEHLTLLALNDDCGPDGKPGYSEEHLKWIEAQAANAVAEGRRAVAMQHHLITPHVSTLLWGNACVADCNRVASRFADAEIRLIFEGHTHIQNITDFVSPAGNHMTAVNVSSIVGYPAVMSRVALGEDGALRLRTEKVGSFVIDGTERDGEYLSEHLRSLIFKVVEAANGSDRRDFADKLSAFDFGAVNPALLFFILRPLISYFSKADTCSVCKKLNLVTFGRAYDKSLALKFKGTRAADIAADVFLALFDGIPRCSPGDDLYELIMRTAHIPKFFSKRRIFTRFEESVREIITGGTADNNALDIENFITLGEE